MTPTILALAACVVAASASLIVSWRLRVRELKAKLAQMRREIGDV